MDEGVDSDSQPFVPMLDDEFIIVQVGVGAADSIDFLALARAKRFLWIETPEAFEQALPAQHLVQAGDAAGIAVGRVEERGVGVGDFIASTKQFRGDRCAALRKAAAVRRALKT